MVFRSEFQPLCICAKFQKTFSAAFLAGRYCTAGWTLLCSANPFPEARGRAEQAWHVLLGLAPPVTPACGWAARAASPGHGPENGVETCTLATGKDARNAAIAARNSHSCQQVVLEQAACPLTRFLFEWVDTIKAALRAKLTFFKWGP